MNPRLLLVDDDPTFTRIAARALERRGFEVVVANDAETALSLAHPGVDYAVVDLVIGTDSGLALVPRLKAALPQLRIVVLTGYASIATAVEAIKLGADNYLTKPAEADAIVAALQGKAPNPNQPPSTEPLSVARLEWEHIQRVLAEHEGNISATARALKMHRRTLQRKLLKRPVKE
ncbi:response regulator transcription factor [Denitratisoma oestradiolicum]|uniref:Photosynthetic apparatus regulatory protein RegA n=1 Tax=Denitratisoma oestradiolicum TaxID=311182 RepID=A0A6S6XXT8_9PROT|nr:response regulator transcription factor [Denitratisoma oestradiolicum]TWO80036.1 two-component system response regulator [Denitratisoma oestradiolicum]CAB1369806.1 Photosynthetic apparatus regulatory protein RegA [Denitratisoma oestradiolicum]